MFKRILTSLLIFSYTTIAAEGEFHLGIEGSPKALKQKVREILDEDEITTEEKAEKYIQEYDSPQSKPFEIFTVFATRKQFGRVWPVVFAKSLLSADRGNINSALRVGIAYSENSAFNIETPEEGIAKAKKYLQSVIDQDDEIYSWIANGVMGDIYKAQKPETAIEYFKESLRLYKANQSKTLPFLGGLTGTELLEFAKNVSGKLVDLLPGTSPDKEAYESLKETLKTQHDRYFGGWFTQMRPY